MKKTINQLAILAMCIAIPAFVQAQTDECSDEMMMSYFPEQYVNKTLEKYQVPKGQHANIEKTLAGKNDEIVRLVEERAAKMSPNPLSDPSKREEAVKIFKDTVYEQFTEVMNAHGINDKEQIQAMLDDIQEQKAQQFSKCFEQLQEKFETEDPTP